MTHLLLVEFADESRFAEAARCARSMRYRLIDAYTPYPVEQVFELFEHRDSRIRPAMFAGGVAMAAVAYGLEYYSAVVDYPYDSGGRPLDAWPAFMLVPFATGILLAAVCGFVMFLFETGLPKLSDPVFAVDGFERVSQDRFVLALEPPGEQDRQRAAEFLKSVGATAVREVER
ncbi:DUF3341 domain-containing protein [Bradyrhizobium sp. WSM 1704]|uniref:DUF3341 domain-containing protein n=1 Tax=Bradyrhizobium semiaridum TaxID=2821404 RepID=UPI001CE29C94|nr:DUF3341 domain-containing protein [Bradyrhizobium semiaridum]MCA6124426.1 DUF3341 domain-containing protein [Bradyrhizobium semiaridum]